MADLQDTLLYSSSNSPPPESDDISLFLHQVLLRSSNSFSSPSHSMPFLVSPLPHDIPYRPTLPADSSSSAWNSPPAAGNFFSTSGACFPPPATVLSSSSVGNTDNDLDDQHDCESEDGYEAMVEEPQPKLRNYSKRSRAAEIHNLSEKRRRSRINEKMKALQKLIPNSNKTDKASMLDEAIEYLKQLQLQVQMLTVRNGLSLYPPDLQTPPPAAGSGGLQSNNINQASHFRRDRFCQENGPSSIFHVQQEHDLNSQTSLGMQQTMIQNHLAPYDQHHQYQTEDNSFARFGKQRNMMIHVADQRSDFQMGANFKDGLEQYSTVPLSENSLYFDAPFEWPEYRKRSYRG